MSQSELLSRVVGVLRDARINYMLTGSIVSSLQGEPRASHDIDVVVQLELAGIDALVDSFPPPRYYLDRQAMQSLARSSGEFRQFNLLDAEEGDKVDFWLLSEDPFDQSRFSRRYEDALGGLKVMVSRPEDTILMKLRWSDMSGGSEKQMSDCVSIYEVQRDKLDQPYLDEWADKLGVEPLLREIRSRSRAL